MKTLRHSNLFLSNGILLSLLNLCCLIPFINILVPFCPSCGGPTSLSFFASGHDLVVDLYPYCCIYNSQQLPPVAGYADICSFEEVCLLRPWTQNSPPPQAPSLHWQQAVPGDSCLGPGPTVAAPFLEPVPLQEFRVWQFE